MQVLKKLFQKKSSDTDSRNDSNSDTVELVSSMMKATGYDVNTLAAEKDARPAVTEKELMQYFSEYFAPNQDFYSIPSSDKWNAYFSAINAARDEMINNADIFHMATKWDISQLIEMLNHPKPAITNTNMLVCGLIFRMGDYGVLESAMYCVDFCEKIPNCIALYLLLTAQKLPKEQRKQVIDAGVGADVTALQNAMESLQVLDPNWIFSIM